MPVPGPLPSLHPSASSVCFLFSLHVLGGVWESASVPSFRKQRRSCWFPARRHPSACSSNLCLLVEPRSGACSSDPCFLVEPRSDRALVVSRSSGHVSCLLALTLWSAVGSGSEQPSCGAQSASASGELEHLQCRGVDCLPTLAPRPEDGGSSWPGPQCLCQSWWGVVLGAGRTCLPLLPSYCDPGGTHWGTAAETPVWLFVSAQRCPGCEGRWWRRCDRRPASTVSWTRRCLLLSSVGTTEGKPTA